MHNQIMVEIYKLKKSRMFYLTIAAFIIFGILIAVKTIYGDRSNISGDEIFLSSISDTSILFVLTIFVSYFVSDDFTNRTIHNEIRIGCSRLSVVLSRVIVVLPFAVLLYMVYTISATIMFGAANGFGMEMSIPDMMLRFVLFALQVMAIQSFTILIVFVCKKASLGMMISICFTFITCNILRNFFGEENFLFKITSFYRITMNEHKMEVQDIFVSFASAIITLLIIVFITHISFQKAELL